MRYFFLIIISAFFFTACNKSNGNNAPKIKYKSIIRNYYSNIITSNQPNPILTIQVSDDDGDIGFNDGVDTSYIYIKNISIAPFRIDSFKFPSLLSSVPKASFKAYNDVDIDLNIVSPPLIYASARPRPKMDSIYYEVYVKDFAKNKSNVIKTDDPLIFISP